MATVEVEAKVTWRVRGVELQCGLRSGKLGFLDGGTLVGRWLVRAVAVRLLLRSSR